MTANKNMRWIDYTCSAQSTSISCTVREIGKQKQAFDNEREYYGGYGINLTPSLSRVYNERESVFVKLQLLRTTQSLLVKR